MIDTIIFSLDRALQLELLLRSIKIYDVSKTLFISIIYSSTDSDFETSYNELISNYPEYNWIKETKRKKQSCIANSRIHFTGIISIGG